MAPAPDDVAVAAAVGGLQETRAGTVATISWTAVVSAQAYDVVSGDLATLQSTGGSFAASTIGCLANDVTATTADDAEALALGEGRWHLVRAVNCAGSGSYDDGSPTQSASRGAGIAASGVACPEGAPSANEPP